MVWLIIILGYFIPLISILLIIYYCELKSGETFEEYFRQNENLLVATVVPGLNIFGLIGFIIAPIIQIVSNIKKP